MISVVYDKWKPHFQEEESLCDKSRGVQVEEVEFNNNLKSVLETGNPASF